MNKKINYAQNRANLKMQSYGYSISVLIFLTGLIAFVMSILQKKYTEGAYVLAIFGLLLILLPIITGMLYPVNKKGGKK